MQKRIYKLGHHLVAFLDVLGQRDRLRGLKKPANAQEEDEVNEVLRQTAGFFVELRTVFQKQFEAFEGRDAKYAAAHKRAAASEFHRLLRFIRYVSSPARRGS